MIVIVCVGNVSCENIANDYLHMIKLTIQLFFYKY